MRFGFDNRYASFPGRFYARVRPSEVREPAALAINVALAEELGLDAAALASPEGLAILAGNAVPDDADPMALAYAGHQFGSFVPQLGDGRAILLGDLVDRHGRRRDVQLKGSGPTPFSRGGDGRAALGPVLREYVLSEAMHALGVPTTRALAAVLTGEPVYRDTVLPGAVLTRVASSHLRVGTFQFFAARRDLDALSLLVAHALERHYPDADRREGDALALIDAVMKAQAKLVAKWLALGFVHGVMNTDNTSIAGETLDYGPAAFLDAYEPARVFSSIDQNGRYAFAHQPRIALWNTSRGWPRLSDPSSSSDNRALMAALPNASKRVPAITDEPPRQLLQLGLHRAATRRLGSPATCSDCSRAHGPVFFDVVRRRHR
ncbi:MAG: protein adenylyltransferase SelO family protein [Polyangiales bacterium]